MKDASAGDVEPRSKRSTPTLGHMTRPQSDPELIQSLLQGRKKKKAPHKNMSEEAEKRPAAILARR